MRFEPIGLNCITLRGGAYRTGELLMWNERLFVKYGAGFAKIRMDGSTSIKGLRIISTEAHATDIEGHYQFGLKKFE